MLKNKKETKKLAVSHEQMQHLLQEYSREHNVSSEKMYSIMSEFVHGFEFLRQYKKAISIYGSARMGFDSDIYKQAYLLAYQLSKDGFAVITGGGPGIMEAANKGAYEAGGKSVGINIKLKREQKINKYVVESKEFKHFFVRKIMLSFASQVYIFFPGGFGTLDEFFEMLELVHSEKIPRIPIILVNKSYWEPLLHWFDENLYQKYQAIDKEDLQNYYLVDNADQAHQLINKLIEEKKVPLK
jgi:uncharacterized protein (TIGR00730 family)